MEASSSGNYFRVLKRSEEGVGHCAKIKVIEVRNNHIRVTDKSREYSRSFLYTGGDVVSCRKDNLTFVDI
jgi:hypothetical protein